MADGRLLGSAQAELIRASYFGDPFRMIGKLGEIESGYDGDGSLHRPSDLTRAIADREQIIARRSQTT